MRSAIIGCIVCLLFSCINRKEKNKSPGRRGEELQQYETGRFLNLFTPISDKELRIIPNAFHEDDSSYLFRGRMIDTSFSAFMNSEPEIGTLRMDMAYACFKYQFSKDQFILVYRIPGEFFSSPVRVSTWSRTTQQFTSTIPNVGCDEESAGYGMYSKAILELNPVKLQRTICSKAPDKDVYENEDVNYTYDTTCETYRIVNYLWKIEGN